MAQYSPELIEQTVSISKENTRQAVENISDFSRVMHDCAETWKKKRSELARAPPMYSGEIKILHINQTL